MTERKKLLEPRRPLVGRFVVSVTEELPAPRRFGVETMKAWIAEDYAALQRISLSEQVPPKR